MLTYGAMPIRLELGWSDRQLEEDFRFDNRCKYCKYVVKVNRDFPEIDAVTQYEHRARFIELGIIFHLISRLAG
jgi:hypothetical protein